jgi:DNA (cytosine-5)-methyltransferase 1
MSRLSPDLPAAAALQTVAAGRPGRLPGPGRAPAPPPASCHGTRGEPDGAPGGPLLTPGVPARQARGGPRRPGPPPAPVTLTAVSLFAGIGGIDLALERAGARVAAAVEIDPGCRGVLRRHFPQARIFDDVREVSGDQLRAAGLVPGRGVVCFGWPCQGNSAAGRRQGMADPRSGLWRHAVRIVAEARPRWLIGENVPNLLAVNDGRDFRAVLRDLDDLGYGVAWRVLDAQFFGLAQRRKRLFLAGCLGDGAAPVEVLFEPESGGGNLAPRRPQETRAPGSAPRGPRIGGSVGTLATVGPGGGWRCGADEAAAGQLIVSTLQGGGRRGHRVDAEGAAGGQLVPARDGRTVAVRRLTPLEWERLQGFPDNWTRWLDDGTEQSDSARYRECGNAVAVPVAEWIARRVVTADRTAGAEGAA